MAKSLKPTRLSIAKSPQGRPRWVLLISRRASQMSELSSFHLRPFANGGELRQAAGTAADTSAPRRRADKRSDRPQGSLPRSRVRLPNSDLSRHLGPLNFLRPRAHHRALRMCPGTVLLLASSKTSPLVQPCGSFAGERALVRRYGLVRSGSSPVQAAFRHRCKLLVRLLFFIESSAGAKERNHCGQAVSPTQ